MKGSAIFFTLIHIFLSAPVGVKSIDVDKIVPLERQGVMYNMSNKSTPEPPWDADKYDYVYYLSGEQIQQVRMKWSDDPAFAPTAVVYGLTFLIGVTGNALVVFALLGDKKSRNATSSFLVSLAIADLIFLLICIPYETAAKLLQAGYWSGGQALCKISGFVEMLSAAASILNLTAVSLERYVVIVHPMKSRSWFTAGKMVKILSLVWAVAICLSYPTVHIMDTTIGLYYNNETSVVVQECSDTNYAGTTQKILFAWYQLFVMFIFPTVVIVYCYAVVICVLWLSTKELAKMTQSSSDCDDESRQRLTGNPSFAKSHNGVRRPMTIKDQRVRDQTGDAREARKQVIKMLLTIIVVFLICWGPKLILNILKRHELDMLHHDKAFEAGLALNLLPYIQSASNPLIYGFMSKNFRRSLSTACRTYCCCCSLRQSYRRNRHIEMDLETKSLTYNGTYVTRFSQTGSTRAFGGKKTSITDV